MVAVAAVATAIAALATAVTPAPASGFSKAIWGDEVYRAGVNQFPIYKKLGVTIDELHLYWHQVATRRPAHPTDPSDPAYRWPTNIRQAIGQARRFGGWMEWTAPRFEITSVAQVEIGVDGEALVMDSPLVFESRPGALRVRLPRHALRVSPSARAVHVLSVSTFAGLARIAVGSSPR